MGLKLEISGRGTVMCAALGLIFNTARTKIHKVLQHSISYSSWLLKLFFFQRGLKRKSQWNGNKARQLETLVFVRLWSSILRLPVPTSTGSSSTREMISQYFESGEIAHPSLGSFWSTPRNVQGYIANSVIRNYSQKVNRGSHGMTGIKPNWLNVK